MSIDFASAPRRGLGLSSKLLILTIIFVMIAEVLIFLPSVANFRQSWLRDRISAARTAALVLDATPDRTVPDDLAMKLLESAGAKSVVLRTIGARRLLATSGTLPEIDRTIDLRSEGFLGSVGEAFVSFGAPEGRHIRVLAGAMAGEDEIEIVLDETPLHTALLAFARNILLLSLLISGFTAALVYLALSIVIVRPMRRFTDAIMRFAENPEDPSRIIEPSNRQDEIGAAERELASLQTQLAGTLMQKNRLAALGLAVSKINHDLRNLLAAAQLFSDRLAESADPTVQKLAPRIVATLDRAIAFCQSTLSYGRVIEAPPKRQKLLLAPLILDIRDLLGLGGEGGVMFVSELDASLLVDADPDQLSRVLLNLTRNAVQALTSGSSEGSAPLVRIAARREARGVVIDVIDNGPGVPLRAREKLFEAFQGSTRPGGTGLGLAIAAELVRAHGGTLSLAEQGGGATFRVFIPDRVG